MTTIDPDAQAVLDFWFGAEGSAAHDQVRAEWFRKDAAFDAQIAQRFGNLVTRALAGGLSHWASHPASRLAHIVLLDQFTRNMFRDTAQAFAGDALALAGARAMVGEGSDATLRAEQRVFAYLPFEHHESLTMQDESVRLFSALAAEAPSLQNMLDYAHKHRAVIARFGRFVHRNELLGRTSTAEELAFLKEPGSRF
jgi:uncharacterized protein (DUF924 family)